MLSQEIIEKVSERLVERMNNANLFVIKKIARKIKKLGKIIPSNAHDIIQIMEYGGDLESIAKELAKETSLNVKDIYEIFDEVAKADQHFGKKYYEYRNKRFIPWEENEGLRNEIKAIADQTVEKFMNLANTRAVGYVVKDELGNEIFKDIGTLYRDMIDEGITSISQGKTTLDEEMTKLIKEIGRSGLKSIEYESGYTRRVDSAVRMNISDGVREVHNRMRDIMARDYGADGVEISVHQYPAPDHELVQGKQFSNEEFDKFQNDKDSKSYDGVDFPRISEETKQDRRAISQYNCYHYTFPIILGLDKPTYTEEQLKKIREDNEDGFDYDGKHYTLYEGSQLQRKIETEIRKNKDIQIMALESGKMELAEESQKKINQLTDKYYELSKVSKLPTRLQRIKVEGYKPIKIVDKEKEIRREENNKKEIKYKDYFEEYYRDYDKLTDNERFDMAVKIGESFEEKYKPIYENMDKETKEAFSKYSGEYYKDINKRILGLKLDDTDNYVGLSGIHNVEDYKKEIDKWVNKMDIEINKTAIDENIILWKGTKLKYYDKYKEGDIFSTKIFYSSSLSRGVAESFTWNKDNICILKIRCPKGAKGMYISSEVGLEGESEILLGRNQKYKYIGSYEEMGVSVDYRTKNKKIKIIELEIIK